MRTTCKTAISLATPAIGILLLASCAFGQPCKAENLLPGASLEEVAGTCGAATLKEHRELSLEETDAHGTVIHTTVMDEWTYDAGPDQLMQSCLFENGRLSEVRIVGYGRQQDPMVDNCRNGELLAVGDTAVDAYLKCGEPLAKEKRKEKIVETVEGEFKRRTAVSVVEWTYRYGRNAPGYTLRFENGKVTEIRTREFGK